MKIQTTSELMKPTHKNDIVMQLRSFHINFQLSTYPKLENYNVNVYVGNLM